MGAAWRRAVKILPWVFYANRRWADPCEARKGSFLKKKQKL
jgi:hypothetical protein